MNGLSIPSPMTLESGSAVYAFKEWSLICDALGAGDQQLIFRKGGIAEGSDGFAFKHDEFALFPTYFHAQQDAVTTISEELPITEENRQIVEIHYVAQIAKTAVITDFEIVKKLREHHIWTNETLLERFEYGGQKALHLAVVRIFRLQSSWRFPYERRHGGCRSWLELRPEEIMTPMNATPVISEQRFSTIKGKITEILDAR